MLFLSLFAAAVTSQTTAALPYLSPMFGSHMVLQRDRTNILWGWTTPGAVVTVAIADKRASGRADANGKWVVKIAPPSPGGPYAVDISGPQHVQLDDVLVGDVWICSGQSNMEMGVGMVKNSQAEIAAATYPGIRLYMVRRNPSLPVALTPEGSWSQCSPQQIVNGGWAGFSAAGYFFGRELHQRLQVPIGLVETCWGGTVAEAWTSRRGLQPFPEFQPSLTAIDDLTRPGGDTFATRLDKWFRQNDPGSATGQDYASPTLNDDTWKVTGRSTRYENVGLGGFDGVVWFRKIVDMPDPLPDGDPLLQLGSVDDADTTFVNGVQVGENFAVTDWRQYRVSRTLFKPGKNLIAVRVLDTGGGGGMTTPDNQVIYWGDKQIPISGDWKYIAGADLKTASKLPAVFAGDPNIPTVLYNGMIAPVAPMAIKGAIWYQGESNVGRAKQYEKLLPAMIADWRKTWGQGDFPFLIVQLANFSTRHPDPVDDAWAELREAQATTSQHVRNTGMAVAIDIGEGADIHPKDKQTVGYRLALSALHVAYGQSLPYSGPVYRSTKRQGSTLRVVFDRTDGGLEFKGPKLVGFQVAGPDHKYYWADAQIDGNTVLVSSTSVTNPVSVRYGWDADPEAGLYNGAGLPAVPFRTDKS